MIGFANNPYFEISLRNVNRMRRLLDYRAMEDRGRYRSEIKAHLDILLLLEASKLIEAAYFMKQHLAQALKNKQSSLNPPPGGFKQP